MSPKTHNKLTKFIGQVCSILTVSVAKQNFNDIQFNDFFVGIIEDITDDGVFARHPMTGCMSFYSWPHVVGIFQEQVVSADDPKYDEIVSEIKKAPPEQQVNIVPVNPTNSNELYLNPEDLAKLSKEANKMIRKK